VAQTIAGTKNCWEVSATFCYNWIMFPANSLGYNPTRLLGFLALNCPREYNPLPNKSSFMRYLFAFLLIVTPTLGKDFSVDDETSLALAISAALPGDDVILEEGEYRSINILFLNEGTESSPITLRARTPGKTILTGSSTLRISGSHLVVDGIYFRNPDTNISDLIQFRKDSKQLANRCRMTNCAVESTQFADKSKESRWVGVYGSENRIDHCSFVGKSGKGTTFVVWLGNGSDGKHTIDHNYFGPREVLGTNGGETIRIGDSKTSLLEANCIVEKNLFEKCNGEAECISNKSCGNVYRGNTFSEVSGTLTLRHGNRCLVEKNVFLGNDAKGTGGIRVIGEDHIVRDNYLERLTGDDARAAICLVMGIPSSSANGYFQVQRALIESNMIVDCEHPILIGLGDAKDASLEPVETLFKGNQVSCPKYTIVEARSKTDGISWKENRFVGKALGIIVETGIMRVAPQINPIKPVLRNQVGTTWSESTNVSN
jgi:poly(beta-D-mannuronate) lyase